MLIWKQLGFEDWFTVTVENLPTFIKRFSKLSKRQLQKHVVFNPLDIDRDLLDHKNVV